MPSFAGAPTGTAWTVWWLMSRILVVQPPVRKLTWRQAQMRSVPTSTTDMILVATKLRCLCLCKVEMSLGGIAGSVSSRLGDHHIGAEPASPGGFRLVALPDRGRRRALTFAPVPIFDRGRSRVCALAVPMFAVIGTQSYRSGRRRRSNVHDLRFGVQDCLVQTHLIVIL
jgi:hypothetical protein